MQELFFWEHSKVNEAKGIEQGNRGINGAVYQTEKKAIENMF